MPPAGNKRSAAGREQSETRSDAMHTTCMMNNIQHAMQHDMQHASCNATCLRSCLLLSIIMHAVHNIIADREHEHVNANCDRLRCLSINMHAVHNIIADREHEHVNANCDRLRCLSMLQHAKKGVILPMTTYHRETPKNPLFGGFSQNPRNPPLARARGKSGKSGIFPRRVLGRKSAQK